MTLAIARVQHYTESNWPSGVAQTQGEHYAAGPALGRDNDSLLESAGFGGQDGIAIQLIRDSSIQQNLQEKPTP